MKVRLTQWLVLVVASLVLANPSRAVVPIFTWGATPGSGAFLTNANWASGAAPTAPTDAIVFTASSQASVEFAAPTSVASFTIDNSGGIFPAYNFVGVSGGTLTVGAGGLTADRGAELTTETVTFASSLPITLGTSQTWTAAGAVYLTVNGVVSGAHTLTKAGNGTLVLGGSNTYSGGTVITDGYVSIAADSGLGAVPAAPTPGNLTFNAGALAATETFTLESNRGIELAGGASFLVSDNKTLTYGGIMAGAGNWNLDQFSGTLNLSGANTFTGDVTVHEGTLRASNAAALGTTAGGVTVQGGATLEINNVAIGNEAVSIAGTGLAGAGALVGSGVAPSLSGPVTLAGDASIGGTAALTLSGVVGESGGARVLTKTGSGALILSGANTYTGGTVLDAGTLNLTNAAGSATGTGSVTINDGTLYIGNFTGSGSLTGNIILNNSSTAVADFSRTNAYNYGGVISGNGDVVVEGGSTLTLSGANTYNGSTSIFSNTTLADGAAAAFSSASRINFQDATAALGVGFNETVGGLSGAAGAVTLASGTTLTVANAGNYSFGGVISGAGAVAKSGAGTQSLGGANTYSGGTTISGGTLAISSDGNLGAVPASPVTNLTLNGGTLQTTSSLTLDANRMIQLGAGGGTLSTDAATQLTFGGGINGTGALTKAGPGTLALTGTSGFTGGFAVNGGVAELNSLRNGGVNSNIGASTNAASNLVINGGTFRYVGPAETIDRLFTVGTAGATIESSGAGGSLNFNNPGAIALSGTDTARTLTLGGTNTSGNTLASTLGNNGTGATSLTKVGSGTWMLSGANSYTGTTNVQGGTLVVANGTGLGSIVGGTVVSAGAVLAINGVAVAPEAVTLSGTGIGNTGALTGSGIASLAGDVTLNGNVNIGALGTLTLSGTVGESGGASKLTKVGAGTLVLTNNNSYSGGTAINGGTLQVASDGRLGAVPVTATPGNLTFNGGTLQTTATMSLATNRGVALTGAGTFNTDLNTTLTVGGVVSGGGTLAKTGAGVLALNGTNDFTGGLVVSGGLVSIASDANLGATSSSVALNNGVLGATADVTLSSSRGISLGTDGTGNGFAVATGKTLTYGGTLSGPGSLTKYDNGTLLLTGPNNFAGTTSIMAGTLKIGADQNLGTAPVVATPGRLTINQSILRTTGTFTLNANRGLVLTGPAASTISTDSGTTLTYNGVIDGAGGLSKAGEGTLVLGGNNTYTGATSINAGVLSISSDQGLGLAPATATPGALSLNGGTLRATGTLTLNSNRGISANGGGIEVSSGVDVTYDGIIAGGSFVKKGEGQLTLGGANSYTGSTTVSGGTLFLNSSGSLPAGTNVFITAAGEVGTTLSLGTNSQTIGTLSFGGINGTGTSHVGGSALTLGGNVSFTGNSWFASIDAATLNLGSDTRTFFVANTSDPFDLDLQVFSSVTGTAGLTKTGLGVLDLTSTTSSYTGKTTIQDGTVYVASLAERGTNSSLGAPTTVENGTIALGGAGPASLVIMGGGEMTTDRVIDIAGTAAKLVVNNGTVSFSSNFTATGTGNKTLTLGGDSSAGDSFITGAIVDSADGKTSLIKQGSGNWVLTGTNTFSGNIDVTGGWLRIGSETDGGSIAGLAGTTNQEIRLSGYGTIAFNPVRLSPTEVEHLTLSSPIRSAFDETGHPQYGTLWLGGEGSLTLTHDENRIHGDVVVSAGTLNIGNGSNGSLFLTGDVYNDGTLVFNQPGDRFFDADTYNSSSGTLIKKGAGSLTLGGNSHWNDGELTVEAGTLSLNTLGGEGRIVLGNGTTEATLRFFGDSPSVNQSIELASATSTIHADGSDGVYLLANITGTGAGNRTLVLTGMNGSTFNQLEGSISDSESGTTTVRKTGFGSWELWGENSYTGGTIVNGGTLSLGSYGSLSPSGNVEVNATGFTNFATLDLHSTSQSIAALTFGGEAASPFARNQVVLGSGVLTLGGDLVVHATNGPSEALIAGASSIDHPGAFSGLISLGAATRTFDVGDSANARSDLTVLSEIGSGGEGVGLIKQGAGTLLLAGSNTYNGNTTVAGGTLLVSGSSFAGEGGIAGPVGQGELTLKNGTTLAATELSGAFNSTDSSEILNSVFAETNVTFGSTTSRADLILAGNLIAKDAATTLHLAPGSFLELAETLNATNAGSSVTFDMNNYPERGMVLFSGSVGSNVGTLTFNRVAAGFINPALIDPGVAIKVENKGYLSLAAHGSYYGGEGVALVPALIDHISPADRTAFNGTLGFDTVDGYLPYAFYLGGASFAGFGSNFTIGSITGAILRDSFTPPTAGYRFGNGGGVLAVESSLTGPNGVSVNSAIDVPHNALTVIFRGDNTYTQDLSVTNSLAILDSPTALPTAADNNRSFALGPNGYVGHTEEFAATFQDFRSRLSTYDAGGTSVIGFDSHSFIDHRLYGSGTVLSYGSEDYARVVSEPLDLSSFGKIYLGSATRADLTGRIIAPNASTAGRTLSLVGAQGELHVHSSLRAGDVNKVEIGLPFHVFDNGLVSLLGASTYTGGTTLNGGLLLLADTSRVSGSNVLLAGPIGTGTLTIPGTATRPVVGPAEGTDRLVLWNNISLGTTLQVGYYDLGDFGGGFKPEIEGSYYGGAPEISLLGRIEDVPGKSGALDIYADTLLGGNNALFSGGVTLTDGRLTIGHNNALGSGPLKIERRPLGESSHVSLAVAGNRAIANAVTIDAFSQSQLPIGGNGSLTINGPVTINGQLALQLGQHPLWLTNKVTANGGLAVNGTLVLQNTTATPSSYAGGIEAQTGAVIFATPTSLPTNTSLRSWPQGYVGLGFVPAGEDAVKSVFLNRFNKEMTAGVIGFDTDPSLASANIFNQPINLGDPDGNGPATGFNFLTRLGSASRAVLSGEITPAETFVPGAGVYLFGGGGGTLTVSSALKDGIDANEEVISRGLFLFSFGDAPLTLRLTGANTYGQDMGSESTTAVLDSGLIFGANAMPADGAISVESGYVGTENTALAPADFFARFDSASSANTILGFDRAPGDPAHSVGTAFEVPTFGDSGIGAFIGSATLAEINAAITPGGDGSAHRFAGYKGGKIVINSVLGDGAETAVRVEIGDGSNPATAGSPISPFAGLSTVALNASNTYSGGTYLNAGNLLVGHSNALGTGAVYVQRNDFNYYGSNPLDVPMLSASSSGVNIGNTFYLDHDLRLGGSISFTLSGSILEGEHSGRLIKSGSSSITLSGPNNLWDGIYVEQGNLTFASIDAIPPGPILFGSSLNPSVTFAINAEIKGISGDGAGQAINIGSSNTLTINQAFDATFPGTLVRPAGPGGVIYKNTGDGETQLRLTGSSTGFNGTTEIQSNVTIVAGNNNAFGNPTLAANQIKLNGGRLAVEPGVVVSNGMDLTLGGTLAGTGTFQPRGTLTIGSGVSLAPGFSRGKLTFDGSLLGVSNTLSLAGGGTYEWELVDAADLAGGSDFIEVTNGGKVSIDASAASRFNFKITPPDSGVVNLDLTQTYAWTVLTAAEINGFDPAKFNIDSSLLSRPSDNFGFSVMNGGLGQNLVLHFSAIPEPSTYAMIGLGLVVVGFVLRRRRSS